MLRGERVQASIKQRVWRGRYIGRGYAVGPMLYDGVQLSGTCAGVRDWPQRFKDWRPIWIVRMRDAKVVGRARTMKQAAMAVDKKGRAATVNEIT